MVESVTVPKRSLVDRINSLPKWARDYIANIETEADPAGTQRRLIEQQDLIRELTAKIAELKGERFQASKLEINGRMPGGPSKMRKRNGRD
jgi:hypothetical protein